MSLYNGFGLSNSPILSLVGCGWTDHFPGSPHTSDYLEGPFGECGRHPLCGQLSAGDQCWSGLGRQGLETLR